MGSGWERGQSRLRTGGSQRGPTPAPASVCPSPNSKRSELPVTEVQISALFADEGEGSHLHCTLQLCCCDAGLGPVPCSVLHTGALISPSPSSHVRP